MTGRDALARVFERLVPEAENPDTLAAEAWDSFKAAVALAHDEVEAQDAALRERWTEAGRKA